MAQARDLAQHPVVGVPHALLPVAVEVAQERYCLVLAQPVGQRQLELPLAQTSADLGGETDALAACGDDADTRAELEEDL